MINILFLKLGGGMDLLFENVDVMKGIERPLNVSDEEG